MDSITLLQVSENVAKKSAEMADKDPHGIIITLVSVAVVFTSLVILYYAYTVIGLAANGKINWKKLIPKKTGPAKNAHADKGVPTGEEAAAIAMALDQELNGETYAAIGMALHQYLNDTVHDNESYIITIRRKH